VLTAAGLLAQRFNSLNNVYNAQLQSVASSAARSSTRPTVDRRDRRAERAHRQRGSTGSNASALIDARDQAIDSLAARWRWKSATSRTAPATSR
jgi:flagellar hook-associated protein 1 FlgK